MHDEAGTTTVVSAPDGLPSYPYLSAVEDRRRRRRAGVVSLVLVATFAVVVAAVLLLTGGYHSDLDASGDVAPTSAAPRIEGPATSATTSRPSFPGKYVAPVVPAADPAATGPPPLPTVTMTAQAPAVVCNEEVGETATVVAWTSTDATAAVVSGPGGQISTLVEGSREIVPSRPCAEAPFEDAYSVSVQNATGAATAGVTVMWTANTDVDDTEPVVESLEPAMR